ncbi:hypothetical protein RchiOBHm_Chr4g0405721 [Rosa chinensis]|uniref:Uncharacterized protein n=1 Tax=Rosa chinensis TaxID=74649 RepID=A0A2P6QUA5_ROSCH|nr:hypothetical protein RchiOBHm_Chr4g0405721 [Rosa chinensis]
MARKQKLIFSINGGLTESGKSFFTLQPKIETLILSSSTSDPTRLEPETQLALCSPTFV